MKLNEGIGVFLHKFRMDHHLTLDQVATAANKLGAGWNSATVSGMERGGNSVSDLANIVLLLTALTNLTGEALCLDDMFDDDTNYEITKSTKMRGDEFNGTAQIYFNPLYAEMADDQTFRSFESTCDPGIDSGFIPDDYNAWLHGWKHIHTLSEKRAANNMGMPVFMLCAWCYHLHRASLDEVTNKIAGENSSPQKRGRITREIVSEIRNEMLKQYRKYTKKSRRTTVFSNEEIRKYFTDNYPELYKEKTK